MRRLVKVLLWIDVLYGAHHRGVSLDLHNVLCLLFNQQLNHHLTAFATYWILSGTHAWKDHALKTGLV
jgi:hypothetical protein